MAPREKEQFTVLCDGLFLNDTKPENWNQKFPWKPSVGFHYQQLDEAGNPFGEVDKKYLKDLWLWQAMGGKNAKGRFFKLQAEHGEVPAKDGEAAKPYVTVMPIAEVFADGTACFIEPPKEGKINTPAPKPAASKPAGVPAQTGPKPAAAPAGAASAAAGEPPKPRPKPNEKFMEYCFTPQTNAFFRMQDGFAEDGWVLNKAEELAMDASLHQLGWLNNTGLHTEGVNPRECITDDKRLEEAFEHWFTVFEYKVSQHRWAKIRLRIINLIRNCLKEDQVIACMDMAWAKLPPSHYDLVRDEAKERLEAIKSNTPPVDEFPPTATPEVYLPLDPSTEQPAEEQASTPAGPAVGTPAAAAPQPPLVDEKLVEFTVNALSKFQQGEMEKLKKFWDTTIPALKNNPVVADAYYKALATAEIPF